MNHKLMDIKGIIFDYGGTLDTDGKHWANVLWESYQNSNIPIQVNEFRNAYVYGERTLALTPIILPDDNFRDVLRKKVSLQFEFLAQNGIWQPVNTESHMLQEAVVDFAYSYALKHIQKSQKILQHLSEHYPLVLVSNFYGNINAILNDFQMATYFQSIIESAVVGVRKPDPMIFKLGVNQLQLPAKEIVVIGDSYSKDIVPAKSLGCHTIGLCGEGWDEKDSAGGDAADHQIHCIEDLYKFFNI